MTPLRIAFALLAASAPALAQTTWYVDATATAPGLGTQGSPYASIQFAIDQASTVNGDTLSIAAGTYVEGVEVSKELTLRGSAEPDQVVIQAPPLSSAMTVSQPLTYLESLTMTGATGGGNFSLHVDFPGQAFVHRCIISHSEDHGVFNEWDFFATNTAIVDNAGKSLQDIQISLSAINNSIIWGNGNPPQTISPIGQYNILDFGSSFHSAEVIDPEFWNPLEDDLHLRPGSPAIDTGDPSSPLDPDGSVVDLGPFPYDASYAPDPVNYCTAGISASGCAATLSVAGTASATASSGFVLTASQVEGAKTGLFFYAANGRQANSWGNTGGFVCVIPPRLRGGILPGGGTPGACDGVIAQDLNARWCSTCPKPAHNPGAGALMQAQLWYRDPASTSNQTSAMSDAIEFGVLP